MLTLTVKVGALSEGINSRCWVFGWPRTPLRRMRSQGAMRGEGDEAMTSKHGTYMGAEP